jgi:hypothetical protein
VTLCVVCITHVEMRSTSFLIEPQTQGRWFVNGLVSKPLGRFFSGLTSKPVATVLSSLASKLVTIVSPGLASKPVARNGFLVWVSKSSGRWFVGCASKPTGGCNGVGQALRSSCLLHVKQVGLGFLSLPQNWRRHDGGWYTWHQHKGCVEVN